MTSRRKFLQAGLVGAAAAKVLSETRSTVAYAQSSASLEVRDADVCVIGAGYAGVTAAREFFDAGKKVVLVEARDRIGGRTWTKTMENGHTLDVGGIWIGPTQKLVMQLAKKFNITLSATPNRGKGVLDDEGKISFYDGTVPDLNPVALVDFGIAQARLDELAQTVNMDQPWKTPNADKLDMKTIGEWVVENTWTEKSKKLLWGAMEQLLAADPARVSLLHTLFFIKAAGDTTTLFDIEGGGQQYRLIGGTVALLNKMIEPFRSSVVLGSPVRAIEQDTNSVTVISDKARIRAKRVVIAVPPALAGHIQYSPMLSTDRDHLMQTTPMGSVVKAFAFYSKRFWLEKGLAGKIVSLDGPIFSTFDDSKDGEEQGVLLSFIVGKPAEEIRRLPPEERKARILDQLARMFGKEAASPIHYEEQDWTRERWSRGCFLGYFPPGIWTGLGHTLWTPEGRIHWAGTETARIWNGYIEGAVESGLRVSKEVIPLI